VSEKTKEKRKKMSNYDTHLQIGNPNEDTEYTGRYWNELSRNEQEEYAQDGETDSVYRNSSAFFEDLEDFWVEPINRGIKEEIYLESPEYRAIVYGRKYDSVAEQSQRMADAAWEAEHDSFYQGKN